MTDRLLLAKYWKILYPDLGYEKLDGFLSELNRVENRPDVLPGIADWYKDAIVYFEKAINLDKNLGGEPDPNLLLLKNNSLMKL